MSDNWNLKHYTVAAGLLALYGSSVCPFIDSLSRLQIVTPIAAFFALGLCLRYWCRQRFTGNNMTTTRPRHSLYIECGVLAFVGVCIAGYNYAALNFPLESGLKVLIGVMALAAFIGMDVMLHEELLVGKHLKEQRIDIAFASYRSSFSQRSLTLTLLCVLVVAVVLVLLVYKQLFYLASQNSIADVTQLSTAVLFESIFVVAAVSGYLLKVLNSTSRLMKFYLGNQQDTLHAVSNGKYNSAVPVVSNDEFGEIAHHTNLMIRTIEARNAELHRTQDATILSLAALAETRDNETGAHIRRTQQYVKLLAEHLATQPEFRDQLPPDAVELIYKSTPLHDIGKVGIPDNILLKPGKLTDDEYTVMKTHTLLGMQALDAVEEELGTSHFLRYAKDVVATHHERWDGAGYPAGLAGENIPLCGRLMAVADVYDALISKRVYKPALSHAEAREIIIDGSGSHFDPAVVEAFIACETQFAEFAQCYDMAA
ncbi:hypothetical protein AB833_31665 [Chromatiales bacterium (ex Bugula neritina AB1)]|nr:hypothetical protein AB833_31665 [Chromatiales bacterium (ex Bugula neritina AB1)]